MSRTSMPTSEITSLPDANTVHRYYRKALILLFSVTGAAVAVTLLPLSRDFSNYQAIFEVASGARSLLDSFGASEPIFSGLCYLTSNLFLTVFILIGLGLALKLKYFASLGEGAGVGIIIYCAHFFVLHDVTQVRASFAISLLCYGYLLLRERRFRCAALVLFLSCLSHFSALLYLPVLYLAALTHNPRPMLRWAYAALLLVLLGKLLGWATITPTTWGADYFFPADTRYLNYLAENALPEVKGLGHEVFLYLKILAIGVIAFAKESPGPDCGPLESDWSVRAGLILTFSCISFVLFYDFFSIGARLSEMAAPFECAALASFTFLIIKPVRRFAAAETALLLHIALTAALALLLFGPQLALLE